MPMKIHGDIPCTFLESCGDASVVLDAYWILMLDRLAGLVPNTMGRVLSNIEQGSRVEAGLFVVGWLKRGPTGIIGDNINDADETVPLSPFSAVTHFGCEGSLSNLSQSFTGTFLH